MYAYGQPHPANTVTATVKLEYEKTVDGWKIVNTDFIDTLDREIYAGHFYNGNTSLIPDRSANPGTSDPGVFAATVVIALALAAVLKRRKSVSAV